MNFDKPDVTDMYDPNGIKRPSDTVIENLTGSFEDSLLTGALGANTEFISTTRVWEPIIERLNEFAGEQDVGFFMRYFSDAGANKFSNPGIAYSEVFNPLTNDNYLRLSGEIYKFVSENQDTLPDDLKGINEELISSLLKQQFDDAQASEQSRSIHNPGPLRTIARFAGGTGSSVGDPINLITAPFGGAVVNQGGKLLWKGVASNMLVNAGAAALTEGEVADWYKKMGAEYTFEDFVYNVSLNAALGGALPLAVPGVRMTWQKSKELADILIAKGFKVDAKTQALLDMIDDFEATNDSNPFRRNSALESLDADAAHEEALTAASAAIQDGNAEFIPPAPLLPLKEQPTAPKQKAPLPVDPLQDQLNALDKKWEANNAKLKKAEAEGLEIQNRLNDAYDADPNLTKDSKIIKDLMDENKLNQSKVDEFRSIQDGLGGQRVKILEKQKQAAKTSPSDRTVMDIIKDDDAYVVRLNAADLEVDAATFQYKSEGDEFGVTDVLRDEKEWIPSWSGTLTVYEYANGKRVVADGHQRIGFAKRVMAQDPSKNIEVNAIIFREADGVSPEEMRVIAALKNIVEGSGDAVDAAKVLRVDPSALPVLPAKSELVQQARGIRPLSNDSFGMVINGIVPAKYAQYVGDLIKDQNLQDAAMRVLAKSKPENKFQAEAMVRQVRDMPTAEVTQTSLFGDELMTESYFFERSKILNQAYTELRKDKSAFETLVRNSERLEAEGNVLVNDANERKAATDAQTIALLQTLANRKGPLSDALNDAARTARDTGNYKSARDGFLTAIRRSIDSGDFEGVSTGDIGRSFNGKAEVARDQIAEPELDGFEEPSGIAAQQQEEQLEIDMFGADEVVTAQRLDVSPIEEDLVAVQDIKMPIDDNLPPDQIRAQVQSLTKENTPIIKDLIKRIDEKFGTESGDNIKDLAKVIQKANRPSILAKKPWHKVSHIRDSYRFKTVIEDFRDVPAIFDELLASGISLVKVDTGKLFEPKEWGWRIIAFDLRMPNGQLVEWYLPIKELEIQKKNEGHLLFEEWRNKSPEEISAQHDAYMATIERSFEGYDNAFQSALDRLGISREEAAASWARAESSMLDAARKSPSSSGITTSSGVRGAETQVPSRVLITEEPDSVQSMTRDVPSSTSANLGAIIDDTSDTDLDITLPPDVNMDLEVPFESVLGADEQIEVRTMTLRELREEMKKEQAAIARLEFCTI